MCILPFTTSAISPSSISVDVAPLNPSAGENTTITLGSYAVNLDAVSITWYENSKKISTEIGKKSLTVVAPAVGSETTVRAVVSLPDGAIEKKIVIRPNVMTMLWQATDSYVPPFYRGKALPIAESTIKVVALPEIKGASGMINPQNMLYSWKRNYNNDANASGYGKNSFTFINDYLEDLDNISVTASTIDGQYSSSAQTNVRIFQPQISFYKNDNLEGVIWERALVDGHRIAGEEIIVAEPYFISPKEIWSPTLIWRWYINGNMTNNTLDNQQNWLPIKVEGGVSGFSNLRLDVENRDQLFGTATKQINVEF